MSTSQTSDPAGLSETADQDFDLFGLSPMDAFVADRIGDLIDKLQAAYLDEQQARKISRADIAKVLDVNRSQITHILQGRRNITLRTLFQLLYCLDRDPQIAFPSASRQPGRNEPITTASTLDPGFVAQAPRDGAAKPDKAFISDNVLRQPLGGNRSGGLLSPTPLGRLNNVALKPRSQRPQFSSNPVSVF